MKLLLRDRDDGVVHIAVGSIIQNDEGDEVTLTYCLQTAFVLATRECENAIVTDVWPEGPATCVRCIAKEVGDAA